MVDIDEEKSVMVKRGSNYIPLVLDTRLLMAVNGKASQNKQLSATYIMKMLVKHCKDDLTPETYRELIERYSKTVYEQRKEKLAKKEAKLKREEERLNLKRQELKLAKQNAKSYGKAVNIGVQKRVEKEIEDLEAEASDLACLIKNQREYKRKMQYDSSYTRLFDAKKLEDAEKRLEEIDSRLDELEGNK